MDFIKRSIGAKAFVNLLVCFLVLAAVYYFGAPFVPDELYPYAAPFVLLVFFICSYSVILFGVKKPLGAIFQEMKAMLTGRPYKKIFTQRIDEVGVLAHFFNDITKNIERISIDVAEGKRMSKELSVGSDIQRKILPKEMPTIQGLSIYGNMRPASEIGGDSFDIIQTASGNTYVYVGDVTGHGVPAALIMMIVNTLIRTLIETHSSGYDVIVNTNRLLKQRIEPRRFMTCVLLRWNSNEQKLFYTGAGHEHILIFRKKEGKCEVKQTGGVALGMVPDVAKIVREEQISLDTGDFVVLYSDGIIEAKNMEGEMFGLARLQKTVEQYANTAAPEDLFVNVSKDFGLFVGEQIQEDDITLIAIKKA